MLNNFVVLESPETSSLNIVCFRVFLNSETNYAFMIFEETLLRLTLGLAIVGAIVFWFPHSTRRIMDFTNRIFFLGDPWLLDNFNHQGIAAFFCFRSCFSPKIGIPNNSVPKPQRQSVYNIHMPFSEFERTWKKRGRRMSLPVFCSVFKSLNFWSLVFYCSPTSRSDVCYTVSSLTLDHNIVLYCSILRFFIYVTNSFSGSSIVHISLLLIWHVHFLVIIEEDHEF